MAKFDPESNPKTDTKEDRKSESRLDFKPGPKSGPISVVIVEDEEIIRYGLKLTLQRAPNLSVVAEVSDGQSAIFRVLQLAPDVVLMDIGMPDVDGIEATREIKKRLPRTKVVMLTSHENGEAIFAAFSAGADAYCLKEISSKQLIDAITNIVEGIAWLDPRIAACVLKACKIGEPGQNTKLTLLELEILNLIVEGKTVEEIIAQLKISLETIVELIPQITSKLATRDPKSPGESSEVNWDRKFD